jgi:signal transduction histidine kinase
MASGLNTFAGRAIFIGLAIHAVLLPMLFFSLLYIVKQSHEELFINDVRKYSRFIADTFEMEGALDNETLAVRLLDSAVLGSDGVYAELMADDWRLRSALFADDSADVYEEDFAFGQHGDNIYFLSMPVDTGGRQLLLKMGFDERPTIEQIKTARQRLTMVLLLYLFVSTIALVLLSRRMTRPLRALQNASRNIAKGRHSDRLQVDSQLTEVRELTTDLESMRRELVGMNVSLRQEIAERKAVDERRELLEGKLRQAQKMETVGVLAGGIAHEFNNILVPIFLYTEQALDDLPAQSPVRAHLERVLKSSNRAKALVQQILTFSHQSGQQAFKPVDIKPIVEETLELLRALIPSTVELHAELAADACMVLADRNQIHQLIMNLGSNAYQSLDQAGGSISVRLDRCAVDQQFCEDHPNLRVGGYIRMSIEDSGHGIDRINIDRIFEPFYTTRAVGKGTGLGLSVVHGIAVSHSGDITVDSEPGKGTTFHVYLPEIQAPAETR